jgi:hypothetical protein
MRIHWLLVMCSLLPGLCAPLQEPLIIRDHPVVIPLSSMSDELYADFREGRLGDVIVRVDEGSSLKMLFVMLGDTLALEESSAMRVRVLRTLFLRVIGEELQFSLDCQTWGTPPQIFRSNLAMMINVDHDMPTGAFALFLTGRS